MHCGTQRTELEGSEFDSTKLRILLRKRASRYAPYILLSQVSLSRCNRAVFVSLLIVCSSDRQRVVVGFSLLPPGCLSLGLILLRTIFCLFIERDSNRLAVLRLLCSFGNVVVLKKLVEELIQLPLVELQRPGCNIIENAKL